MIIHAEKLDYTTLNEKIRESTGDCRIQNCLGQRFIAAGMQSRTAHMKAYEAKQIEKLQR